MLKWRHRRMYDGKATMITLALDDGADEDMFVTSPESPLTSLTCSC